MANILITGANGQLGSELRKIGFSPLDEVFFTDVAVPGEPHRADCIYR